MTRWEYIQLAWWVELKKAADESTGKWVQSAAILRPGMAREFLLKELPMAETWDSLTPVSDLGARGWELVTIEVNNGAYIPGEGQGYHAIPVLRRWWFKRPVS